MAKHRPHIPLWRRIIAAPFHIRLIATVAVAAMLAVLIGVGSVRSDRPHSPAKLATASASFGLANLSAVVNGNTVTASVTLTSDTATTLDQLGVCVRDASGNNLDYAEDMNVAIGPGSPATFTQTKSFADGTYDYFGCIYYQGAWTQFGDSAFTTPGTTPGQVGTSTTSSSPTPTASPTTTAPATTTSSPTSTSSSSPTSSPTTTTASAPTAGPAAGKSLAFDDEFNSNSVGAGLTWGQSTSSYPGLTNPNDSKLDYLNNAQAVSISGGIATITATPRSDGYWNTGLLTTEPGSTGGNGFQVRAGDFLVNRVMMPTGNTGAWPALWTWLNGNGEIDAFEWHTDNPNLLELSNHITSGSDYYTNANLIAPGKWVWIGVKLGTSNDTWYVGDTLDDMQAVYSDGSGIGSETPYIIADLSVSSGTYHPAPSGTTPIVYKIDTVRDYR